MLFGNVNVFAIEYELDQNYGGEWLFGKICYWINGIRIGAYDLGTSLRDVLFQMKYILHYCGNRYGESLCELDAKECFYIIDNALYECDEEQSFRSDVPKEPVRYDIRIPVDVFDQWKIYLIECKDNAMLIYKNIEAEEVNCCSLSIGKFDQAIREFHSQLEVNYEKEVASSS